MSEFKLSDRIDKNKIFLVNYSKLEGRYDPVYYKLALKYIFKSKKLDNYLIDVFQGQVQGSSLLNNIKVLKVKNLDLFGNINFENVTYIHEMTDRKILQYGDILTPFRGQTIFTNKFAFFDSDEKVTIDNNLGIIRLDKNKILPKFFRYYISSNIGFNEILKNVGGAGIPALTKNIISNIDVPIVDKEIQQKIIDIMDNAYSQKKQKEQQAKELLDSIDDYLLKELDITLPKIDNSLDKRKFAINLSEISGSRFDCDYYSYKYKILQDSILKAKTDDVDIDEIESVVSIIKGGKTPASNEYSDTKTLYPIIKAGSYTDEYIDLEKLGYTKEENSFEVQKGDIFILSAAHQSHYVGRQIKILNEDIDTKISYVGELICIRTIEELCNPMYLFSLLNLEIYKILLNREKTGQTSHIYGKDIKKIKIPLPKIEKQNEIAEYIQDIRDKAKQLKTEALQDLANAKQKVENMILGQ